MQHRWPRSQVEREQLQTETDTLSPPPPIFFSRWSEFHLVENLKLFKHILEVRVGAAYQWSERMRDTYLFIYLGTGREGEREREKHQCLVASCVPHTGDFTSNPRMCPDWESNWQPFGLQASTQSTEPYHPGQGTFYLMPRACAAEVWEPGRDGAKLLDTSEHLGQTAKPGRSGRQEPSPEPLNTDQQGV